MSKQLARRVFTNFNITLQKIEKRLKLWNSCCVFFGNDLVDLGPVDVVREVLEALVDKGVIYKVGVNLFCYTARPMPIIVGSKGAPTLEEIGCAVNSRNSYLQDRVAKDVTQKGV